MVLDSQLHISSMEGQNSLSNSEFLYQVHRISIPVLMLVSEEFLWFFLYFISLVVYFFRKFLYGVDELSLELR